MDQQMSSIFVAVGQGSLGVFQGRQILILFWLCQSIVMTTVSTNNILVVVVVTSGALASEQQKEGPLVLHVMLSSACDTQHR